MVCGIRQDDKNSNSTLIIPQQSGPVYTRTHTHGVTFTTPDKTELNRLDFK